MEGRPLGVVISDGMNLDGVFKAYDIRGKVPEDLTPELAYDVGRALADWLPQAGPVAVGRDMRPSSASLAEHVMRGLVHQGREVWDVGLVTSDLIYFAVGKFELAGGVMVTASHNPGGDDGLKLCGAGAVPIGMGSGLDSIKQVIEERNFKNAANSPATVVQKPLHSEWLQHVFSFVNVKQWQPYRVAIDAGNGMAATVLPEFTETTPLAVVPLFYELDGSFPNRPSDPTLSENLSQLKDTVLEHKLDFGLAFDGDGDRVVFVDEAGQMVSPNLVAAILLSATFEQFPKATVVLGVRMSRLLDDLVNSRGGKLVRSKVGNPYISAAMRSHGAPFGAELSAHYYFKDNYSMYSGLIAAALVIDVLSRSGQSLSQLAGQYQKYYQSPELSFKVHDQAAVLKKLEQKYQDGQPSHLDGVAVHYPDWWFVARPSNTEPLLRLTVEADTAELLQTKLAELKKQIT